MPVHRLVLLFMLLTLLGIAAVYLQIERVQLGYRVSVAEARLAVLREAVRDAEVRVHRRRDLAALEAVAGRRGIALGVTAAGNVVYVSGRRILVGPPRPVRARLVSAPR